MPRPAACPGGPSSEVLHVASEFLRMKCESSKFFLVSNNNGTCWIRSKSCYVLALTSSFSSAYDYLQDFCVAVPDATVAVFVNGKVCKNPKQVTAYDFLATDDFLLKS
ncbi:unnamed protein product [Coffea canephora]|uniref:Uncharacterized protein n=1 Tax=Coffea canephora TaxID=49390 RepID=A0A068V990_COFCA|nr:unnamed protein product [Coffea canephora]